MHHTLLYSHKRAQPSTVWYSNHEASEASTMASDRWRTNPEDTDNSHRHGARWITWWEGKTSITWLLRENLCKTCCRPQSFASTSSPSLPCLHLAFRTCGVRIVNIKIFFLLVCIVTKTLVLVPWIIQYILIQHHRDHLQTCSISQRTNYTKIQSLFF